MEAKDDEGIVKEGGAEAVAAIAFAGDELCAGSWVAVVDAAIPIEEDMLLLLLLLMNDSRSEIKAEVERRGSKHEK